MLTTNTDPQARHDPGCLEPRAAPGRHRSTGATDAGTVPDRPVAVGVDVVDVLRFARMVALRGPTLGGMVFTPRELETCRGSLPRLAVRLAAKEAAAKALGLGIGPVAWREVETRTGARGEPELAFEGGALAAARAQGLDRWAVSLSHDAARAVAVIVATGKGTVS